MRSGESFFLFPQTKVALLLWESFLVLMAECFRHQRHPTCLLGLPGHLPHEGRRDVWEISENFLFVPHFRTSNTSAVSLVKTCWNKSDKSPGFACLLRVCDTIADTRALKCASVCVLWISDFDCWQHLAATGTWVQTVLERVGADRQVFRFSVAQPILFKQSEVQQFKDLHCAE